MDDLTAAIVTLVVVSPSIIVLTVIIYGHLLEFWGLIEPACNWARALVSKVRTSEYIFKG